jgi:hypothetical protein
VSVFPDAAQYGPPPVGKQMRRRDVVLTWLVFPLITLGIYHLVWYYSIQAEMKEFDPRETKINPVGSLLTILFGWILCGIPPLVSYYNTGKRIANAQRAAGLPQTCNPLVGLLLMFVFSLGILYHQTELNKVTENYPNTPAGAPVQLAA